MLVAPGVYREYVDPIFAGEPDARITYKSTEPLAAVITGAERITSWKHYQDNVWVCRVPNSTFGAYNPYTTFVYGDWYFAKADKHTGCVYLNDRALYETSSLEDCIKGEVYECSWVPEEWVRDVMETCLKNPIHNYLFLTKNPKRYTEQDSKTDETIIYANFQGKDPNAENVEINVRRECFMPSKTGVGYITVSGFTVTKAATTWAPPAAYQDGMIGPHWSKGWIIEDCDISNTELQVGDVIERVNGTETADYDQLNAVLSDCKAGDSLTADCCRYDENGKRSSFTITFQLMEDRSGNF